MWTLSYKGYFINCYLHKDDCYILTEEGLIHCKSLLSAKRKITILIKKSLQS